MLRKGLDKSVLQSDNIWKIASKTGIAIVRQTESKKEVRLEVISLDNLDVAGISKIIFDLLKSGFLECNKVLIGGVKFTKDLTQAQVIERISSNLNKIEKNTGWKLAKDETF